MMPISYDSSGGYGGSWSVPAVTGGYHYGLSLSSGLTSAFSSPSSWSISSSFSASYSSPGYSYSSQSFYSLPTFGLPAYSLHMPSVPGRIGFGNLDSVPQSLFPSIPSRPLALGLNPGYDYLSELLDAPGQILRSLDDGAKLTAHGVTFGLVGDDAEIAYLKNRYPVAGTMSQVLGGTSSLATAAAGGLVYLGWDVVLWGGAAAASSPAVPEQLHHFASVCNSQYTPRFQAIAGRYGLKLNGSWNIARLRHIGRHPNEYHDFVEQGMKRAASEAGQSAQEFVRLFNIYVAQPVKAVPEMLDKIWWKPGQ